jgi:predicted nucleic acid-binding protein
MGSKILLDANVVLDFLLQRNGYENIQQIFELIEKEEVHAFVTPAIIHIAAYFLVKVYSKKDAKDLLILLLTNVQIIDASHETVLHALNSRMDDIEDALQYSTAMHYGVNCFISKDKRFKKQAISVLPVCTPEEFLTDFI